MDTSGVERQRSTPSRVRVVEPTDARMAEFVEIAFYIDHHPPRSSFCGANPWAATGSRS
jgi:hypothetical protein